MYVEFLYPGGREKAVTFSYDDGRIYDRRLVELFNRYRLKATFNLNSGLLNQDGFVKTMELKNLYKGHEIAAHGVNHRYLRQLTKEQLICEMWEDRRNLEKWSDGFVLGSAYAFGEYSDEIAQSLKSLGLRYARTAESTHSFAIPNNFMKWKPTCHHHENIIEKAKLFLNAPGYMKCPLFYIWGHSFEFERDKNWEVIEQFCEIIAGHDEIWYATNLEIQTYIHAAKNILFNAEGTMCINQSAHTVWLRHNEKIIKSYPNSKINFT